MAEPGSTTAGGLPPPTIGPRRGGGRRGWLRAGTDVPRRVFHADGAGQSGLARLSYATVLNFACDATLAVALANTLFFTAATAESRSRVALYLLVTVAPFALVAPVIGPLLDRLRRGRRLTLAGTFALRAVLAAGLALSFDSWTLYPLALAMLVLSKTFGVVKASITPHVVPPALDLVRANARLTVLGHVGGSLLAGGLAAGMAWLAGSSAVLWLLVVLAVAGAAFGLALPAHAEAAGDEESASLSDHPHRPSRGPRAWREILTRPLGRDVMAALWAESSARLLTGFLTFFLAFVAKSAADAGAADQATLLATAGAAAGIGTFVGNTVGSHLSRVRPLPLAIGAAAAGPVAAGLAALVSTSTAAAGLACVAAVAGALGKVGLDSIVQTDVPARARSSAFGRSETALQLGWVAGGALGVLVPPDYAVGFPVVAVVCAALLAQSVATARGRSFMPTLGGRRPRVPGAVGARGERVADGARVQAGDGTGIGTGGAPRGGPKAPRGTMGP